MIGVLRNFLKLAFSQKEHLKKYPLVSICIVEQSLKVYGDEVTINDLSGEILLPQMNKKYQQYTIEERGKMLSSAIPLIVYNCIYHKDVPNQKALLEILGGIEEGLQDNKNNRWIKMHHEAYLKSQLINKEFLLCLKSNVVDELEVDRVVFENICGKKFDLFTSMINENKNKYLDWIEEKAKGIQSS